LTCINSVLSLKNSLKENPDSFRLSKILSFTDNRQDASLQTGHYNDFVRMLLIRGALYEALTEHKRINFIDIAEHVVEKLNLKEEDFATEPSIKGDDNARKKHFRLLREVIFYRLYQDLKRGWRVIQPNLEQCGLVSYDYSVEGRSLKDFCLNPEINWNHTLLNSMNKEDKYSICKKLLDMLRKEQAISATDFSQDNLKRLKRELETSTDQPLFKEQWIIPEDEKFYEYSFKIQISNKTNDRALGYLSKYGKYIKNYKLWNRQQGQNLTKEEYYEVIDSLLEILNKGQFIQFLAQEGKVQLKGNCIEWCLEAKYGTKLLKS
jgi:hypothetical protein